MSKFTKISIAVILGSFALWGFNDVKANTNSHVIQETGNGVIDWTSNTITVTGSGAPPEGKGPAQARLMAERAAQADAYRQLAEIVNGVKVDSETIVKNFVTESDVIKTNVQGLIKGARIIEKKVSQDGAAECVMSVQIYGVSGLADSIDLDNYISKKNKSRSSSLLKKYHSKYAFLSNSGSDFSYGTAPDKVDMNNCLLCHKTHNDAKQIPESMKKHEVKEVPNLDISNGKKVTGLVIDARDLGLSPAMDPAVFDTEQNQLYIGPWDIDPDYVINYGVIGYFRSLEDAQSDPRVGNNPLVMKAESLKGSTDMILSSEDGKVLKNIDSVSKFLQKYAVNVVM